MLATKTYLTGGLGSRWDGEAFGDPYELPADRAYAESCAAIGGIQWAWRMLLATGDPRYADAAERMLLNGFLAGVSLRGSEYFYVNPLQLRTDAHAGGDRSPAHGRRGWSGCVAIEHGPIVYAVEQVDEADGVVVDDLRLDPTGPLDAEHRPDLLGGVTVVSARGRVGAPPAAAGVPGRRGRPAGGGRGRPDHRGALLRLGQPGGRTDAGVAAPGLS
jgi:DUF1680 family protein